MCRCGLGQALLCLAHQDLLFKRGHRLLLQTENLLTCSSPPLPKPPKSKTAGQEKGRAAKSRLLSHLWSRLPHLSHLFLFSQLFPRAQKASMRTALTFLQEGQGKKLTFSDIQYSPYSPESHFVLQRFKYAQPSCFPSSIQHYREKKKFSPQQ